MTQGLYKAYHQANRTVAKTRQVVMLYDGAIRFLKQAQEAIEKKDYETRYNKLTKVSEIITGLQSCLDFEHGGATARSLYDFYSSLDLRIMQIHRTNDLAVCKDVIEEIKKMRNVWDQIDRGNAENTAASEEKPEDDAAATLTTVSA